MTLRFKSDNLFFTSDTHYFHKGVIEYAKRPFKDIYEMNEALIANHNSVVGVNDTVFLIGDVSFGKPIDTVSVLGQLNGTKFLVKGNHDKNLRGVMLVDFFKSVDDLLEIDVVEPGGTLQRITLCHYAMRVWNKHHYGAWQLYGHSHGNLEPIGRQLDVGVDVHDYKPISYEQVKTIIMSRPIHVVDHHESRERTIHEDGESEAIRG